MKNFKKKIVKFLFFVFIFFSCLFAWYFSIYWLDIQSDLENTLIYIKKIVLTQDWTNTTQEKIILDWSIWDVAMSWNVYIQWNWLLTWNLNVKNNLDVDWTLLISPWAIWDSTINSDDIIDNTIKSEDIKDWTIQSIDILDNSLTSSDILDWTIQWIDIANNTIWNTNIANTQTFSFWAINMNWNWNEWNINTLDSIVWYNDLFIKSNNWENANIYYWAGWHIFYTNWLERLRINQVWNVWIWTWTPISKLEVNWWIKIWNDSSSCNSVKWWTLRYSWSVIEYCNWISWGSVWWWDADTLNWMSASEIIASSQWWSSMRDWISNIAWADFQTMLMADMWLFTPHTNDCNSSTESFIPTSGANYWFCIEKNERTSSTFYNARQTCMSVWKRLPEPWEYMYACFNYLWNGMTNGREWSSNFTHERSSAPGYGLGVQVFGYSSCGNSTWNRATHNDGYSVYILLFRCLR